MDPVITPIKSDISQSLVIPNLQKYFVENSDPEAVEFINTLLYESVAIKASDLLLEPMTFHFRIRIRVDGVLYELGKTDISIYDRVVARLKVMSELDVSEKRKVQEGQFTFNYNSQVINFRLEIATTVNGELVVLRIHEKETSVLPTKDLGMNQVAYQNFQNILSQRSGLVLVCGPTGCGKTTTLYSTIADINKNGKYNVMTVEDPVEYNLEGANQMQTQNEIGFTFATGLKTILRLSPDVVLVGEIRDQETAEIAVQTGLSGLMVLSTLHAEDSVGALFRILDLGIESYLMNSSLVGIVAQRLVRRICQNCRSEYTPSPKEVEIFQKVFKRLPKILFYGKGCAECKHTGYKGRLGIFEVLSMTAEVRDIVRDKVSEHEMRSIIFKDQVLTLIGDGLSKAESGLTTIDEVLRSGLRSV